LRPIRRTYVSPQLTLYGHLSTLTATGSGSASESSMGSMSGMACYAAFMQHSSCI
jgi:hypothetical protein